MKNISILNRVLAGVLALTLHTAAAERISFAAKPLSAGRASLTEDGFRVSRTLGVANFTPELAYPVELTYESSSERMGLFGFAWRSPQLESSAVWDKDGVLYGYLDKVLAVIEGKTHHTYSYHVDGQLATALAGGWRRHPCLWIAFAGLTASAFVSSVFDWHVLFDFTSHGGLGTFNFAFAWALFAAYIAMGAVLAGGGAFALGRKVIPVWKRRLAVFVAVVSGLMALRHSIPVEGVPRVRDGFVVKFGRDMPLGVRSFRGGLDMRRSHGRG